MNGEDGQEQAHSRPCTNVHILSLKSSDNCALGEFLWGGMWIATSERGRTREGCGQPQLLDVGNVH